MKRLKLFIPLAVFISISVLFWVGLKLDPSRLPSVVLDKPVPEFKLPSLADESIMLTQADMPGKPYLLNVWATWCPTCKYEIPYLLKLAESGIPIYGIDYRDDSEEAKQMLAQLGNPYIANIVDKEGTLIMSLGVYGAPETFVVDAKGIVRHKVVGVVNEENWTKELSPYFLQK
jgi:cytochrome c biogenesis protein CcmG, thiol:disulfide interchange protein DsbE